MLRPLRPFVAALAGLAAACASAPPRVPPPAPPAVVLPATGLQLVVVPADAVVEVNGAALGIASGLGADTGGVLPLPPGVHRVSVKKAGYATWRAEVSVGAAVERLTVTLVERR